LPAAESVPGIIPAGPAPGAGITIGELPFIPDILEPRIIMPEINANDLRMSSVKIIQALKFDHSLVYREGTTNPSQPVTMNDSETEPIIIRDPELVEALRELRDILKKPIGAEIVYDKFTRSTTIMQEIDNDGKRI
jgi:hypothetical protein